MKIHKKNINFIKEDNYLGLLVLNIADLLAGFLVLITHYRSKSIKRETEENKGKPKSDKYELIYIDLSMKKHKYSLIFLVSIIDFLGQSSFFIYYLIFGNKSDNLEIGELVWLVSVE